MNDNFYRGNGEKQLPGQFQQDMSAYDPEVLEQIRIAKLRRARADQLARDKLHAEMILVGAAVLILVIIISVIVHAGKKRSGSAQTFADAGSSAVTTTAQPAETPKTNESKNDTKHVSDTPYSGQAEGHDIITKNGITYVDGIMIVNKTFSLPEDYAPGLDPEAEAAFNNMAAAAWGDGVSIWICSGYRSYSDQETLFDSYAYARGLEEADSVSARPGHSEHQSGLCMDVNSTDFSFAGTTEALWLENHCAEYGFIIRFPQGKEAITGYEYEAWHIRYVGVEAARAIKQSGQCLEEYLNVTSDYADSLENEEFIRKYSQIGNDDDSESGNTDNADANGYDDTGYSGETNYNDGGYDDQNYDYNDYDYGGGYDYGYTETEW